MIEERPRLPGECLRLGPEGDDLGRQPVAPIGFRDVRRDPLEQVRGVLHEAPGRVELLDVRLGLELRRAEETVDEARDVLVEPEGEEEIVSGDPVRDGDAAVAADGDDRVVTCHGRSPGTDPIPWPGARPFSSPTKGIPWRSTASRLIRSADVFASATSRT